MIKTNEHINYTIHPTYGFVEFKPDDGYAMWMDDEEGNIDPVTGQPYCYWLTVGCPNVASAEERAPHIWAKQIDETMEVYGLGGKAEEVAANTNEEGKYPVI